MYDETNGIRVDALSATAAALVEDPSLALTTVRATNRWVEGGHSRTQVPSGSWPADLPEHQGGADRGPTPVELLLHAVASCLSASVVLEATLRGLALVQVESSVEAECDQRVGLALGGGTATGIEEIRVSLRVVADGAPDAIDEVVAQARLRSPVIGAVVAGVPVIVDWDVETP